MPVGDETPIPFIAEKQIRFHHCDPAGIVFFPQYFVLFNEVIEDWYTFGLDTSFVEQITKDRVSTPLAKVSCEFLAPSRIGEIIRMTLSVKSVGRTSVTLQIEGSCDEEARVRAELVAVNASLETLRPLPFSDQVRDRIQRFIV
ncbi:acyl-CoA thioesterase [Halomonas sp. G15]|uniref:acyl-CoA thioesterase n=1 Tax=Halomonas sp. G15 TaxID=2903521 RepID=UPI001E51630A|nr:thioesterase family protein [Halomonas sp. G15]MCE0732438.1 acyl-CoA thioesterase [Halomonas sp. G15]